MTFPGEKEPAGKDEPKKPTIAELLLAAGKMQPPPVPKRMSTTKSAVKEASKKPKGEQRI